MKVRTEIAGILLSFIFVNLFLLRYLFPIESTGRAVAVSGYSNILM
jgi:hypothetical protein